MAKPTAAEVKARFLAERGGWPPAFEQHVEFHPEFVEAYLDFSMAPWRSGALDAKTRELIYIAIDIATTHLHAGGARAHIESAFRQGATTFELIELCELVVVLGIHTMTMAAPLLAAELDAAGQPIDTEFSEAQLELRERYIAERGTWPPPFDSLLALDPAFIQAYLDLSAAPIRQGTISPKVRELIFIAIDASTTHLQATGTRAHIRSALREGATAREILEVLEMTSVLGIHGTQLGTSLVFEVAAELSAQ